MAEKEKENLLSLSLSLSASSFSLTISAHSQKSFACSWWLTRPSFLSYGWVQLIYTTHLGSCFLGKWLVKEDVFVSCNKCVIEHEYGFCFLKWPFYGIKWNIDADSVRIYKRWFFTWLFFFSRLIDQNQSLLSSIGNSTNIKWHECSVNKVERPKLLKQKGCVIWITGFSASVLLHSFFNRHFVAFHRTIFVALI